MKNLILGSGIVGLLAKKILGPTWDIVPFYKSRFFSFNPALDDNFVYRDPNIDNFIQDITKTRQLPVFYKKAWSIGGHLIGDFDDNLCRDWLWKIFGSKTPSHSSIYLKNRMSCMVYDNLRVNSLYQSLVEEYKTYLISESAKGQITNIGDHYIIRNNTTEEYDNIVSTIPLDALCSLMHAKGQQFESKTIHYLHVSTDNLDFEGHNQTLVVDGIFDFFKVTNIAPSRYLFYCLNDLQNPGAYLMNILKSFDIIDGTSIESAICVGEIPKLDWLKPYDITCIGSNAQWDWCVDIGSCILRLIKFAERGFKPAKPKSHI